MAAVVSFAPPFGPPVTPLLFPDPHTSDSSTGPSVPPLSLRSVATRCDSRRPGHPLTGDQPSGAGEQGDAADAGTGAAADLPATTTSGVEGADPALPDDAGPRPPCAQSRPPAQGT
jgi:hypothetical protein